MFVRVVLLQTVGCAMPVSLLDPTTQTKFAFSVPTPPVLDARAGGSYVIQANRVEDFFMGLLDSSGNRLHATVQSYQWLQDGAVVGGSFYGPTIVAQSGVPVTISWANNLPSTDPMLLPIDNSIHVPVLNEPNAVPIATHLHGGHTRAKFDGVPDAWYTRDSAERGRLYSGTSYTYDNTQQAATLIYHDHALGYTPQNVYAGLAGFYLIRDANLDKLFAGGVLPGGGYEVGLAIQDHAFTSDGKLYLPAKLDDPLPQQFDNGVQMTVADMIGPDAAAALQANPSWNGNSALPEFFGDVINVNGMAWPKLDVNKGEYLLHFANPSDSRFYVLNFSDPNVKVTLVGADGGLLKKAATISDGVDAGGDGVADAGEDIILAPGDRLDIVVDFSKAVGDVVLQNTGPAYEPFKGLGAFAAAVVNAVPGLDLVGDVMKFVLGDADGFHSKLTTDVLLNPSFKELSASQASLTRKVGLFEMTDAYGRVLPMLGLAENKIDINGNPVKYGAHMFEMPASETPLLGATEAWEIFNYTADAHPVHLHLVQYQVIGRFQMSHTDINNDGVVDQADYTVAGDLNGDGLVNDVGAATVLRPEDKGWQDTVWVAPGEVLKIVQKFDLPGEYVWHCHILSHENNDMMRPMYVINKIDGGSRADRLVGGDDIDSITAFAGNDVVAAGSGDDRILATKNDGFDRYDGGAGVDTLDLSGTSARAVVNLGGFFDRIQGGFAAGAQIGVDRLTSIENVVGSSADDFVIGSGASNLLAGGDGADSLNARGGDDRVWGQAGNDVMWGGEGADAFLFYRDLNNKVNIGHDTIKDFESGIDRLEIDTSLVAGFTNVDEFLANNVVQVADGVQIIFDADNTVTLLQTTITASDLFFI